MTAANSHDKKVPPELPVIGWREWIGLPDLGIRRLKAKVDSGARSSSLHGSNFELFEEDGQRFVRFQVHPYHRKPEKTRTAVARLIDVREVRSSSGVASKRLVIATQVQLMGKTWEVELTLAERGSMGFRMLLGREAIRGRFLIDSGQSYYGGIPAKKRKSKS